MGKTYEALERAEKEYRAKRQEASPEPLPAAKTKPPRQVSAPPAMERYKDLKTNLLTLHPDGSIKTILFAGTAHGDGASTTAINFATTLARSSQLKVLLIDANLTTPCLHDVFKIDHVEGLSDLVTKDGGGDQPINVTSGNLHVIPCGSYHSEPVTLLESIAFDQFLKRMRDRYDYVLLDAPPVHGFSECRVLCAKVDGVVLVIESGKTRRHVALSCKKRVEDAGGKLLGVVVNKRRYYIPDFIYRRL